MKTLKRIVSVALAFLMLFSSISILASADLGDGNENSFVLTTKFYREKEEGSDEWIETTKAAKGEEIRARIFLETDFAVGTQYLFWVYPTDFMTFNASQYRNKSGLYYSKTLDFENQTDGWIPSDAAYEVNVQYGLKPGDVGPNDLAIRTIKNGYMTEDDYTGKSFVGLILDTLDYASIFTPEKDAEGEYLDDQYVFEISFVVNPEATGVGTLTTPEAAICTPERNDSAVSLLRAEEGDEGDPYTGEEMYDFLADWELDQDATVSTQSTFTFNVDGKTTAVAADIGTVYSANKDAEGNNYTVTDPAIGKVFLHWMKSVKSEDGTVEETGPYTSAEVAAMEVGYEDATFTAVFEAAEATYGVKVVEQKTDGTWPTAEEIAAITPDYWETEFDGTTAARLGSVINAKDYPAEAGFTVKNTDASVTVDATDDDILIVELQRNEVSVTFDGGDTVTGLYGATKTAPKKTTDAGYSNEGWYTADGVKVADDAGEFTMPAEATNYKSNIVADKQDVTVNVTYYDGFQDKIVTVPVTIKDATATGRNVEIVSYIGSTVEGTDYILISDITAAANLEHYQFDSTSASNNLKGVAGAEGLTLTVGYAPKNYRVVFDTTVTGVVDKIYNKAYGSTVTASELPTEAEMEAANPGYSFEGWYTDVNDETTEFVPGETKVSGAATYVAKFTANKVKVNYVFAGEEGHGVANPYPDGKTAVYDDVVELPVINAPDGWEFEWTVSDTAIDYGTEYRVGTQDVTVTGTWTRKTYTITYYYDENKVSTVFDKPVSVKFGDSIPADLVASQAGKQFVEWSYELEDGTPYVEATDKMPAHNLVAIATLQDIVYTVQFMKYDNIVDGEASAFGSDTARYMGSIDTVPDTTEEGYNFTGWKYEDGTPATFPAVISFQDESGAYISVPENGNWTLLGNAATAKVYATYTPQVINVTFDPDGGYFVIEGEKVTTAKVVETNFGECVEKPEDNWNIAKDGYTFQMWDPDFWEDEPVSAVEPEFNTYTAQWLPNVEYKFAGNVPAELKDKVPAAEKGVEWDALITVPTFSVDGYGYDVTIEGEDMFDNEDGTFNMGTTPVTVTYTWYADDHVAYTVNTWFAKVGSAEYEAGEPLTRYGTTGDTIVLSDADKTAYEGFTFSKLEPADKVITGDGLAEVNAYFTRKMVDVVVKDGEGETIIDTEVQFGDTIDQPATTPDPVNPGEEFEKWVDEAGNEIDWTKPVDSEDPIVIKPQYKKIDYKVTYVTAGDVPAGYQLPNETYKNITNAHYNEPVVVPTWNNDTVPGYNVAYTVTGANGTEGAYTVGEGDVTVTATWSKKQFTVTYVTNGTAPAGYTLPNNVAAATIGTAIEIPAWVAQGAPEGYILGFEVSGAKNLDNGSYEVYNSNVTVTATWTYKNYTVDYVTVGTAPEGYELPADITDAIIGTEFSVPTWDKEAIPGYNVTIEVKNANLKDGVYSVDTSDVTVTATWTYKKFDIDYVTVGTAPAGYELPADVADAIINTEVVIPDWATEDAPAGYTMKLDVVGAVDGKVYDSDVTVTVTWEYIPYTVTYSYDSSAPAGATVPAVEDVYVGKVITLATPAAVSGYKFNDWVVTGATKNDDGTYTVGAGNVTAVGSWTAESGITYKVLRWFEIIGQDGQYAAEANAITFTNGVAGQPATYNETVTGFTYVKTEPADAIIKGDGTTLINVYYDRKTVDVTIYDENDEIVTKDTVEFGDKVQKPEDPKSEDEGMKFDKWVDEDKNPIEWPITVNSEDPITIKPVFVPNTYRVNFYEAENKVYAYKDLDYKSLIEKPSGQPTIAGYDFIEWRKGGVDGAAWAATDTVPVNGVDYYAYFEARTDITYEIHKYFQAVGSTEWDESLYEFDTIENATAGSKVTLDLDELKVPGFTIDTAKSTYKDVVIAGDGSTDFIIYYTRNNVVVNVNGEDVTLPAGDTITKDELEEIIADTKDDGYNYTQWKDENGDVVTFPYTVPPTGGSLTPVTTPKYFTITFVDKDGNEIKSESLAYKSALEPPAHPEWEGYKPAGWYNVDDDTAIPATVPATNATYKAAYTNSTNTGYSITIYMMDLEGNYTIKTTTAAYGTTGDEVRILPESYTGLYEDTTHPNRNLTDTIAADGSTELRIYYARKQLNVTFDGGEAIKVYYGAALPKVEDPAKVGQKFTGWTDAEGKAPADYAAMPEKDLAFTSNWEDVYYTITYVINGVQKPVKYKYGETVAEPETPNEPGMSFTGWTPEVPKTMPAEDLIIVAQFGTAYYTATYLNDVNGEVFAEYTVMFGQTIPVPAEKPAKDYHTFVEWMNVPETMPAGNITIAPKFERIPVKLVPMDGSETVIDRDEMIIYGFNSDRLSESIIREQFLKVEGDGYFTIDTAVEGLPFYGTGAVVKLYDNADPSGEPIETYVIIVFGDLNGDARINASDDSIISSEISAANFDELWSYAALPGYNKYKVMAADINGDGLVNATDRSTISNVTLGSERINQVTKEVIRADV